MEITVGSTTIRVRDIAQCYIGTPSAKDLYIAEKRCNGHNVHYEDIVPTLSDRLDFNLIEKYKKALFHAVTCRVRKSRLRLEWREPDRVFPWSFLPGSQLDPPMYGVALKHWVTTNENCEIVAPYEYTQIFGASDLLPAIDYLLTAIKPLEPTVPQKGLFRKKQPATRHHFLFHTMYMICPEWFDDRHTVNPTVLEEISLLQQQLSEAKVLEDEVAQKIKEREALREAFFQEHAETPFLIITQRNKYCTSFMEGQCDFDIYEKEKEIREAMAISKQQYIENKKEQAEAQRQQEEERLRKAERERQAAHEEKLRRSYNRSEKLVNYELKWLLSSFPDTFFSIVGDCETRFKYNVIFLRNTNFRDEPQEFDHLVVCPAGIISIETKHWSDHITIRPDGKFVRTTEDGEVGMDSPKMQIARHDAMLNSMLPGVPIHNILCLSNTRCIIDGVENFTTCPIVILENLREHVLKIAETKTYSLEEMQRMVDTIESFKFNRQPEVYECIPSRIGLNNNDNQNTENSGS